jgi:hypothetical protein
MIKSVASEGGSAPDIFLAAQGPWCGRPGMTHRVDQDVMALLEAFPRVSLPPKPFMMDELAARIRAYFN